jgi:hypothetical protein
MCLGTAQLLRRDDLAGRRLYQRRAGKKDRALIADDDRLVGHGRHIGAAGCATAHHAGDLRNALGRHLGLVIEDRAEMVAVGKDLGLMRKVGAAAVDEVDTREAVLHGDFLCPQMFLDRHREIGATLHRCVIGDDHHLAAGNAADTGDDAGAWRLVAIHAVGRQRTDLQERAAGIEQKLDAAARQELALAGVALARRLRPSPSRFRGAVIELVDEGYVLAGIRLEDLAVAIDHCRNHRHDAMSSRPIR